jgi:transcription-repair coupling factor (superfamily II helicase)
MYRQLMERTMSELKGEPVEPEQEPEIVGGRSAYIPETYVSDIDQRLTFYRRLARVTDTSELEDLRQELQDRFGPLPAEAMTLLEKIMLKVLCKSIGIQRLDLEPHRAVFTFSEKTPVRAEQITQLIQQDPQRFHFRPDYVLEAKVPRDGVADAMGLTKKVLQELI